MLVDLSPFPYVGRVEKREQGGGESNRQHANIYFLIADEIGVQLKRYLWVDYDKRYQGRVSVSRLER